MQSKDTPNKPDEPIGADACEFAENPEPRCPCVLLLDTSGSMEGQAIASLNESLIAFKDDLCKDSQASRRVEVAVLTFNDTVTIEQNFVTADRFVPPVCTAGGHTHMGTAILEALSLLERRKEAYRQNGIMYYRPWIFMITDGEPDEDASFMAEVAGRLRKQEKDKKVVCFAVGVGDANMDRLRQIVCQEPVKLNGVKFVDMFVWLSRSMKKVSQSHFPPENVLPQPKFIVREDRASTKKTSE